MELPRVNPVGMVEHPRRYSATPRRYPRRRRVAAGIVLAAFLAVGVTTTVYSLGAACLTTDAASPFDPLGVSALSLAAVSAQRPSDAATPATSLAKATFAGGCFWCMEPPFDELDGVVSTTSGYIGGTTPSPTYQEVSAGRTGHTEAVEVVYDPALIGYAELLEVFWRNVDPLTADRQFCDRGSQYRTGIFYHDAERG